METESNRPITRQLYHQTYISYPLEITFVCHLIQPYMNKSFAQAVGIEPTRRSFGDLTDTLSVTCMLFEFRVGFEPTRTFVIGFADQPNQPL